MVDVYFTKVSADGSDTRRRSPMGFDNDDEKGGVLVMGGLYLKGMKMFLWMKRCCETLLLGVPRRYGDMAMENVQNLGQGMAG